MMKKLALVATLLLLALPTGVIADTVQYDASLPTILMGEMWFANVGGSQVAYPPGTEPENIITLAGAASGELRFNISNEGAAVLHEIRSPLFMAAKEVKVHLFDPNGNWVAEFEGTDMLELELAPNYKVEVNMDLAGAVSKSFQKDSGFEMVFEISCHVEGHYEAGMRALITVAE